MTLKKTAAYAIAICLIVSYCLFLAYGTSYVGGSEAYRVYYLEGKTEKYIPDERWQDLYCTDTEEYLDGSSENLGTGWVSSDDGTRWTVGSDAYLYLYVEDPDKDYRFQATIWVDAGYHNRLIVNGTDVGDLYFAEDSDTASVAIRKGLLVHGINTFCIHTDDEIRPFSELHDWGTDSRGLNLHVASVLLSSGKESNSAY